VCCCWAHAGIQTCLAFPQHHLCEKLVQCIVAAASAAWSLVLSALYLLCTSVPLLGLFLLSKVAVHVAVYCNQAGRLCAGHCHPAGRLCALGKCVGRACVVALVFVGAKFWLDCWSGLWHMQGASCAGLCTALGARVLTLACCRRTELSFGVCVLQ